MKKFIKTISFLIVFYFIIFLCIVIIPSRLKINFLYIFYGLTLLSFICSISLFLSKKRDEIKMAWIIFIIFVPIIGLSSYLFFGRTYKISKKEHIYNSYINSLLKQKNKKALLFENNKSQNLFLFKKKYYHNQNIKILTTGPRIFQNIFHDLTKAKKYILLSFFIIENGELIKNLEKILFQKINEGVLIYILYDHAGSIYKFKERTFKNRSNNRIKF